MISILIPAYKTSEYIEECLDSIQNQEYLNTCEYEIIVGVDGCEITLNKLLQIQHKYDNLRIIMMNKNYGLFITLNTLLSLAKYENIIKFDSDDIMLPTLIKDVMLVDADLVRFLFYLYYGENQNLRDFHAHANGVYRVKKKVFNDLGGYQPWKCAADTEFLKRFKEFGQFKMVNLNKRLFYYRQHNQSLSKKIPFNKDSLRLKYHAMFKNKTYTEFKINPILGEYKVI